MYPLPPKYACCPSRRVDNLPSAPHPFAAYALLSVAGRGAARRFLPQVAELLPRAIPERLQPRPVSSLFPSLPYPGEYSGKRAEYPWVDGLTDTHTHARTETHTDTQGQTRALCHTRAHRHTH
jgi:hypothetical protein